MIVFLAALCIAAPMLILLVNPFEEWVPFVSVGVGNGGLGEFNILPRLATTAVFTGGALLWGAYLAAQGRWPSGRWPVTLWAAVAVFVLVNILVLVFAADWRFSLMGEYQRYQGLATTLLYVLLFGVTAVAVRTTRDLRWLLLALFIGAVGAAGYASLQEIEILREGKLTADAGPDWIDWSGQSLDRAFGTMGQANVLGAFLVATASASLFLVLTAKERWQQVAFGAGLAMMVLALLFTVSRSAYLAAGVVVLLWGAMAAWWLLPRFVQPERMAAARVGVVAGVALPLLVVLVMVFFTGLPGGRVAVASDENSQSVSGRISFWRLGLEMLGDRPLLGYGHDGFSIEFSSYRDEPDLPGIGTDPLDPESSHNFFVDLASGTGLLGLLAFVGLVGAVFWHAGRRFLATEDTELRLGLMALAGGAIGYLAAVFFGFMEATSGWLFWLLLGAMVGLVAQVPLADPQDTSDHDAANEQGMSRKERRKAERARKKQEEAEAIAAPEPDALLSGAGALALSLLGAVALAWAATIIAADVAAGQAAAAAGRGEHPEAARLAGRAVSLNPLQRTYLFQEARAHENVALRMIDSPEEEAALQESIAKYEMLTSRFQPEASELLGLATVRLKLAQVTAADIDGVLPDVEAALELDPFNTEVNLAAAMIYERAGNDDRAYVLRAKAYCWGIKCDDFD